VVACPGRLEDLIRSRGCSRAEVEIRVLDEADLGFLPAVGRLLDQTPTLWSKVAVLGNARRRRRFRGRPLPVQPGREWWAISGTG